MSPSRAQAVPFSRIGRIQWGQAFLMCLFGQVGCVPLAFSGCELLRNPAQVALHRHLQRPCAKRAKRTAIDSRPRRACPSIGDAACWPSGLVARWSVAGNVLWCVPANRRRCDVGRDLMGIGVDIDESFAQRIKNNEARSAALYLTRRLTSASAMRLAERNGGVSQTAISKAVRRAERRRDDERRWKQRLARLETSLRSAGASKRNAPRPR